MPAIGKSDLKFIAELNSLDEEGKVKLRKKMADPNSNLLLQCSGNGAEHLGEVCRALKNAGLSDAIYNLAIVNPNSPLRELPPEIGELTGLRDLVIMGELTELPWEIGKLTALKTLNVADNKLTTLPASLGNCKELEELDVSGNPLIVGSTTTIEAVLGGAVIIKQAETKVPAEEQERPLVIHSHHPESEESQKQPDLLPHKLTRSVEWGADVSTKDLLKKLLGSPQSKQRTITFDVFQQVIQGGDAIFRQVTNSTIDSNSLDTPDRNYAGINRVELEFKQLCDPMNTRPIFRRVTGDRTQYYDMKTKTQFVRKRKGYLPVAEQKKINENPVKESYYDNTSQPLDRGVSRDEDRGKPKNTIFSKKRSCTLISQKSECCSPMLMSGIGFIYDDTLTHHKGDRYGWKKDPNTYNTQWIGDSIATSRQAYEEKNDVDEVLPGLPEIEKVDPHETTQPDAMKTWINIGDNTPVGQPEILRGLSLKSLIGLCCHDDLNSRLHLLCRYFEQLEKNYDRSTSEIMFPVLPLLIMDDNKQLKKEYIADAIEKDVQEILSTPHKDASGHIKQLCQILGLDPNLDPITLGKQIARFFIAVNQSTFSHSSASSTLGSESEEPREKADLLLLKKAQDAAKAGENKEKGKTTPKKSGPGFGLGG